MRPNRAEGALLAIVAACAAVVTGCTSTPPTTGSQPPGASTSPSAPQPTPSATGSSNGRTPTSAPPSETQTPTSGPPTNPPPTTTPSEPTTAPSEPNPDGKLREGDKGAAVTTLQERLTALGYWLGPVDGHFGDLTEQAVYALQKAAGIGRDGVVGEKTRTALEAGVRPTARSDSGHIIEVNRDKQLLLIVNDGVVEQIFNTSTGTYEHYSYDGEEHLADTPPGRWTVYRQVDGWDNSPLGELFRPKYFNTQGIAVHGYTSVPPYPASHGCVRVSLPAIDWIWRTDQMPIGTTVLVY